MNDVIVTEVPQPSLWDSIREAVRGWHQDFTTGSLNRAILLLAIPMVLEIVLSPSSPWSMFSGSGDSVQMPSPRSVSRNPCCCLCLPSAWDWG